MQNARKILLSFGAAIAGIQLARTVSGLALDDVLRPVRLSRRRSRWSANLAYLGAGVAVGGVTALLLAPVSGRAIRAKLSSKAEALADAASRTAGLIGDEIRTELRGAVPGADNGQAPAAREPG